MEAIWIGIVKRLELKIHATLSMQQNVNERNKQSKIAIFHFQTSFNDK